MTPSGVTRPSDAPFVYQTLRSGPTATFVGEPVALGIWNSVISPRIVMRPTRLPSTTRPSMVPFNSMNHMLPSAPAVMSPGPESGRGNANSVTTPAIVMRPILLAWNSENQMLPSGPAASARGPLNGVGISNSVMTPAGVMRPILPAANMPNQMLPSAPSAIARGWLSGVGMRNSAISPRGVMRAIWSARCSENHMLPSAPSAMMRGELSSDRHVVLDETAAVGIHAADAIAVALREPDRAVGRERNRRRAARGMRQRELRDFAGRGQSLGVAKPTLLRGRAPGDNQCTHDAELSSHANPSARDA